MLLAGVSLLMMVVALLTMVLSVVMLAVMVVVLVLISDRGRNDSFQFSPNFLEAAKIATGNKFVP